MSNLAERDRLARLMNAGYQYVWAFTDQTTVMVWRSLREAARRRVDGDALSRIDERFRRLAEDTAAVRGTSADHELDRLRAQLSSPLPPHAEFMVRV